VPLQFEARKVALKQDRTGFVLTLALHPDEIPEELLRDFVGARYMCVLARIQDDESATQYNGRVQKAGILCRDYEFQVFMDCNYLAHGVNEDAATNALCVYCGITSRTELNGNSRAMTLFDDVVKDYEGQGKTDDPF